VDPDWLSLDDHSMSEIYYQPVENPSEGDLDPIGEGLDQYNISCLGPQYGYNPIRLAIFARGEDGKIVGGASGKLLWEWLHVDMLWVSECCRGQGVGSRLLERIEALAAEKGFRHVHLETTSFQAEGFYLKKGYTEFGRLDGKPSGVTWHYLKKDL
jgi:GNAT superfamily N-acetyltransferase